MATEPNLIFTVNAANKVSELISEEGNPALNLRVYIMGGGCSGYQYGFTFDEEVHGDDTVVTQTAECPAGEKAPVRLLVDPMSFPLLAGAEIDYVEDTNGARFVIRNPNAKTTCGCGSSFSA